MKYSKDREIWVKAERSVGRQEVVVVAIISRDSWERQIMFSTEEDVKHDNVIKPGKFRLNTA